MENVLNVLMYLIQHHIENDYSFDGLDQEGLIVQLQRIGFTTAIILQAFHWLSYLDFQKKNQIAEPKTDSFRVFSVYECEFINLECRNFILALQRIGILNSTTREMVIHQVLDLKDEGVDISLIKWVTLMVLFSQAQERNALSAMEFLVLDDSIGGIH